MDGGVTSLNPGAKSESRHTDVVKMEKEKDKVADKEKEGRRIGATGWFFAWCGGSFPSILKECGKGVQESRAARGAILFVVAAASSFIAGNVWAIALHSATAGMVIGTLWFLVFFNLDRALMASMDGIEIGKNTLSSKLAKIGLRLTLIAFVADINAEFVQLVLFESEVRHELVSARRDASEKADADVTAATESYDRWLAGERERIRSHRENIRQLRDSLSAEVAGMVKRGETGKVGDGPAAAALRKQIASEEADLAKEEKELSEHAASGPQAQILQVAKTASETARKQAEAREFGIADRVKALHRVAKENPFVWIMYGVFLLLESLAFLLRLFSDTDQYDLKKWELVHREASREAVVHRIEEMERYERLAVAKDGSRRKRLDRETEVGAEDMERKYRLCQKRSGSGIGILDRAKLFFSPALYDKALRKRKIERLRGEREYLADIRAALEERKVLMEHMGKDDPADAEIVAKIEGRWRKVFQEALG
jgi:hypothetical protein